MARRKSNHEGSIRQRKSDQWEARYTDPHTKKRESLYGTTEREVRQKLYDTLDRLEKGLPPPTAGKVTLQQFMEQWLDDVVQPTLGSRTHRTYRGYCLHHIFPCLGATHLNRLTHTQIQHFLAERLTKGGVRTPHGMAPRSIRQMHMILSSALHYAEETGLLARNPARLARHPKVDRHDPTILNLTQARLLINALREHPLGALYLLAATTGFRAGELLGLSWGDIDLETGRLLLSRQLEREGKEWHFKPPKTAAGLRLQILPTPVCEMLRAHQRAQQRLLEGVTIADEWKGMIFLSERWEPLHERVLWAKLKELCLQIGVPVVKPHELRHTCASILIARGAALKDVSQFLGHSSIGITADTYVHLYEDHAHRMREHVTRAFFDE